MLSSALGESQEGRGTFKADDTFELSLEVTGKVKSDR